MQCSTLEGGGNNESCFLPVCVCALRTRMAATTPAGGSQVFVLLQFDPGLEYKPNRAEEPKDDNS